LNLPLTLGQFRERLAGLGCLVSIITSEWEGTLFGVTRAVRDETRLSTFHVFDRADRHPISLTVVRAVCADLEISLSDIIPPPAG
jgi:hypothetical protein